MNRIKVTVIHVLGEAPLVRVRTADNNPYFVFEGSVQETQKFLNEVCVDAQAANAALNEMFK